MKGTTPPGTTPRGTAGEVEAARYVRDMFGRVAPRYDRANHLLSMNIDRIWRRRTVSRVKDILRKPEARVVDLCCGTGDLTLALSQGRHKPAIGGDFCHPMLLAAATKSPSPLFEADAISLPFKDASIDLLTCAFGVRNLANYDAGLREFRRVLRAGGKLAILEFSQPRNRFFAMLYGWYSRVVLPCVGGIVSGEPDAYSYLPESVRKFPGPELLATKMREAGFREAGFELWTGGIVALHIGSV